MQFMAGLKPPFVSIAQKMFVLFIQLYKSLYLNYDLLPDRMIINDPVNCLMNLVNPAVADAGKNPPVS